MLEKPATQRLVAFVDGQALFHAVRHAFGYTFPNYDIQALCDKISAYKGWQLAKIYFYTGIPERKENAFWNGFWAAKLAVMGTRNIGVFTRPLRYAEEEIKCKHGKIEKIRIGREKGIDVRIALDVVRLALNGDYDVALILSQDQDLSEAVKDVRGLSWQRKRWLWVASAFPCSQTYDNDRGIDGTEPIRFGKAIYDACIDPVDYRPPDVPNPALPL